MGVLTRTATTGRPVVLNPARLFPHVPVGTSFVAGLWPNMGLARWVDPSRGAVYDMIALQPRIRRSIPKYVF